MMSIIIQFCFPSWQQLGNVKYFDILTLATYFTVASYS